ncbi:MAG: glucosaminidase domain-containing protein [Saprospiraceae bacterium]|nr:glucosaminidase domain-containing protein [Saprospiraceae bacterium]
MNRNKLLIFILPILFLLLANSYVDRQKKLVEAYIERYAALAIQEMNASTIPASITLAQALLESNFGQSELAKVANNHFGIKCNSANRQTDSECFEAIDDEMDSLGNKVASYFKIYDNATQSYKDHTNFLVSNPRYKQLFSYNLNYKDWANGLQRTGYATDSLYASKLIYIIKKNALYLYDNKQTKSEITSAQLEQLIINSDDFEIDASAKKKSNNVNKAANNKQATELNPPPPFELPQGYKAGDGLYQNGAKK